MLDLLPTLPLRRLLSASLAPWCAERAGARMSPPPLARRSVSTDTLLRAHHLDGEALGFVGERARG
jgi:hypothetical protein